MKRWREGVGIQPQAATVMADVLSVKLGRRVSPGDLGFFDLARPAALQPTGYPSTLPDALSTLGGLADERSDAPSADRPSHCTP
ncbi:hypothetical protein [Streptomyces sp. NPDC003710]